MKAIIYSNNDRTVNTRAKKNSTKQRKEEDANRKQNYNNNR